MFIPIQMYVRVSDSGGQYNALTYTLYSIQGHTFGLFQMWVWEWGGQYLAIQGHIGLFTVLGPVDLVHNIEKFK